LIPEQTVAILLVPVSEMCNLPRPLNFLSDAAIDNARDLEQHSPQFAGLLLSSPPRLIRLANADRLMSARFGPYCKQTELQGNQGEGIYAFISKQPKF
jgi:hypothetical protein